MAVRSEAVNGDARVYCERSQSCKKTVEAPYQEKDGTREMSEQRRELVSRLRQVAEALASHFAWASCGDIVPKVESATQAELRILDDEGNVIWKKSMKVSEL